MTVPKEISENDNSEHGHSEKGKMAILEREV